MQIAYFLLYLLISAGVSVSDALRFDAPSPFQQGNSVLCFFFGAGSITFVQTIYHNKTKWQTVLVTAVFGIAAASLVFSLVRQQTILLATPSLFLIPGAITGYCFAQHRHNQHKKA